MYRGFLDHLTPPDHLLWRSSHPSSRYEAPAGFDFKLEKMLEDMEEKKPPCLMGQPTRTSPKSIHSGKPNKNPFKNASYHQCLLFGRKTTRKFGPSKR